MTRTLPGRGLAHRALLYRSLGDLVGAAVPILREGVREGEVVLFVSLPEIQHAVREALPAGDARTVSFESSAERYSTPARALSGYQRMFAGHSRAGRRVRLVAEQPLFGLPEDQVAELCRGDAAFNEVGPARDATVVCTYDVRSVPAHAIAMARRSHPEVIEGGRCRASPSYTDPTTLLAQQYAGEALPEPAGDVALLPCPRDAAEAREFVIVAAAGLGLAEPGLGRFVTAVNEVVTNALVHALLDSVRVWSERGRVLCEVRDYGFGLADPLAGYRHPEPWWASGRGLWLARQLTDLVQVRSGLDGSTFRLHAELPGGGCPDGQTAPPLASERHLRD